MGSPSEHRCTVRIVNESGLHARPCHAIVVLARDFGAELWIGCGDREVNGRSILELMTLEAACGRDLDLRAVGDDARALLEALRALVVSGFEESS